MGRVDPHQQSVKHFLLAINRNADDLLQQFVKIRVVHYSVEEVLLCYDVFVGLESLRLLVFKFLGLGEDSSEVVDHLFAQVDGHLRLPEVLRILFYLF